METQNSISGNLVYQRKLKGLTQKDLSEKTNVTVRTIQRIEKGESEPHLQTVKLLAAALEIEVEDLLPLQDPKEENIQKKWLLMIHATPFLGFILPLFNIFIPLFVWIHKRDDNPVYDNHGRKVINFQITITLLFLISFIALVSVEGVGFFLFIAILPLAAIVMILNVISAVNKGTCFYPLSIPFISKRKNISNKNNKTAAAVIFLVFSTAFSSYSQNIQRLDNSTITRDSLKRHIEYLMQEARVTGIGLSVFNNDEIAYTKSFGFRNNNEGLVLNETTNMYGASLSKAVFSVIVMKLVEDNVIDLDIPLESYLPKKIYEYEPQAKWHDDYSDLRNDTLYHKITGRMCLAHTSGFPNWRFFEPDKKLRVKQEPGSRYMYSGEGMVYLQVVLEKLTGKSFEDLAQEIVFQPLKMENSSFKWQPEFENDYANGHNKLEQAYKKDKDNEPRAPSTLETTIEDYNKFLLAALNQKIITENSWKEIFRPQIRIRSLRQFGPLSEKDGNLNDDINLSYGLGWGLYRTPYGWAASKGGHGSGFEHFSVLFPEVGKGILIMTNSENGESIFKELLEVALKDVYTPWEWNNYIPYDAEIKP
ncbi:serine hydrolase [Christiangramia crocea]|uniref:Serine hydrolase n=1 Tax=Christiangramia crocea TaxID=2904124 RepID=A0A9X1UUI0_9FLAO|nr:serine hydrolase [Gramella crocea]MCG9970490.1 serine hydrolase [Gramella crocea]